MTLTAQSILFPALVTHYESGTVEIFSAPL